MTSKRILLLSKVNYKEKNENDLTPDTYYSSDSGLEDINNQSIWLKDDINDSDDINLESDLNSDNELNELNKLIDNQTNSNIQVEENDIDESDEDDENVISLKLQKLQEFVKQSQVYSGIISDTLLKHTKNFQVEVQQPLKKKCKKDITSFFKREPVSDIYQPQSQPSLLKNCVLKPYQLEGLNWLTTLYENGLNGILADEMGLGKTIQTIALLTLIYEIDTKGPFLIATPLSTLDNWVNEFIRFAPDIPILKYYSNEGQKARQNLLDVFFKKTDTTGVIITSYEVIMKDIKFILTHQWKFLIIDEGHRLKNINCKLIKELKRINTSNRLLLTGTPLQNNLAELWSLLNFILPDIFTDFEIFNKWFDFNDIDLKTSSKKLRKIINNELEKNLISNLHMILKPFLLRRLKKTVLLGSLPPKREYIINCPLTNIQSTFYKAALTGKLRHIIIKQAIKDFFTLNSEHIGKVSNILIRQFIDWKLHKKDLPNQSEVYLNMEKLYQNYIHRELMNKRLQNLMIQLRQIVDSTLLFFFPLLDPEELSLDLLLKTSGKLQILQQLVPNLISKNHKVIIFSQFIGMLDLIEDWCDKNLFKLCRIDGTLSNEVRKKQIDYFNSNENLECKIFLISTRAGGLGINLTAADSVILFDSDWNPQVDLQAMDRCHRIGQVNPVIVYRLCCDNTIEQVILSRAVNKRKLEKLVIQMGKFNTLKKLAFNETSFRSSVNNDSPIGSNKEFMQELYQLLNSNDSGIGSSEPGPLTDQELDELTDRSSQAYDGSTKEFPHLRLFETINGFDDL